MYLHGAGEKKEPFTEEEKKKKLRVNSEKGGAHFVSGH